MPGENPMVQALMGMAGQGAQPGGPAPGGPPGAAPPGQPPGGAPPGAGGQPGGPPGGGQPDPRELVVQGLMALQIGMSQLGGDETMGKVRQMVQKFVERMMKTSPQGRQGAAMGGMAPPGGPPGVGPMPGQGM